MHEFRPASVISADTELAEALQSGDPAALRELYQRFGGLVFTVAVRVLGDRGHAEEATQQTFLQAWRHADRFEAGRDFAPWLATIARRASIDIQRREQRRPSVPLDTSVGGDESVTEPGPDAEQMEMTWTVRRAIESLSPEEREIVNLQHVDGFTHHEIAERLGLAVGTVKSRSFRAHRRLERRLAHLRTTRSDAIRDGDADEA